MEGLTQLELWEAADRAIQELDALESIFGSTSGDTGGSNKTSQDEDPHSIFQVLSSKEDLEQARQLVLLDDKDKISGTPPELQIEIRLPIDSMSEQTTSTPIIMATVRIRLPIGYPEHSAAVLSSLAIDSIPKTSKKPLSRARTDRILSQLNTEDAQSLLGSEAVWSLIENAKDMISTALEEEEAEALS